MFMKKLSSRTNGRSDDGAVAIIVGLVVGMGVLMGAAAISIDVGGLYAQRREVQNGADAAAFSLAKTCADSPALCQSSLASSPTPVTSPLSTLAGLNAEGKTTLNDSASTPYTNGICVKNLPAGTTSNLPICDAPSGTFVDCPELPTALAGVAYVEVHTQTLENGTHILPSFAAKAFGFNGANVQACARVAFGPATPGPLQAVPLAVSLCDWESAVGYVGPPILPATTPVFNPGVLQKPPSGAWPGYDTSVNLWPTSPEASVSSAKDVSTCTTWNGHAAPGGFSWLDQPSGAHCTASVAGGWVPGDTGNSDKCSYTDMKGYWGKTAYIPVYDCTSNTALNPVPIGLAACSSGNGNNLKYHIMGYAAFYVTGWSLSGENQKNVKTNANTVCTGPGKSGRCLTGWFTRGLIPNLSVDNTGPSTDPMLGGMAATAAG